MVRSIKYYPNIRHATRASLLSQPSSHTGLPLTKRFPSLGKDPPRSSVVCAVVVVLAVVVLVVVVLAVVVLIVVVEFVQMAPAPSEVAQL